MIKDIITYLNAKINSVGYFNEIYCLVEKIKQGDKIYPALYTGNNEYKNINFDVKGSFCYWRKSADVTIDDQDNQTTAIGVEYKMTIPLKLVGFIKKEDATNDQYFADNICTSLIANITTNSSALKSAMKAKKVSIIANKYVTDGRDVANEEFDNVDYEPRYTHAFFSIDFDVVIITNNQCYSDLCNDLPINFGYVTIKDGSGNIIERVLCGGEYICTGGGGDVTVENSDQSFSETVPCGDILVLEDTTYNIYVNGNLDQSFILPSMNNETINITA